VEIVNGPRNYLLCVVIVFIVLISILLVVPITFAVNGGNSGGQQDENNKTPQVLNCEGDVQGTQAGQKANKHFEDFS